MVEAGGNLLGGLIGNNNLGTIGTNILGRAGDVINTFKKGDYGGAFNQAKDIYEGNR